MKKCLAITKIIILLLGAASLLYGIAVLMSIGPGHWFNYAFMVLGIVLIALGIFLPKLADWICRGEKDGKGINCRKVFVIAILCFICLCLINFGIFEAKVIRFANSRPDNDPCWVIVLGAKVKPGNVPSLEYAVRLQTAAEYLSSCAAENSGSCKSANQTSSASEKNNIRLILTGGKGSDEPASESSVGRNYIEGLLKIGNGGDAVISPDNIFLEEKSTSTSENLKFAREIIEAAGGSATDSVVIVSSSFHLYRASLLARGQGYTNTSFLGSTGLKILIPYYYVREYAAYVRERLPF